MTSSSAVIQGELAVQPLAELLQYLQKLGKRGQLFLERAEPPASAAVYFVPGRVVHAHRPPLEGETALLDLLSWHEGRFLFLADAIPERETITTDLGRLLLEGMRRQDELAEARSRLPPPHAVLFPERDRDRLAAESLSWREWRMLESVDGQRDIATLIQLEPGAELECALALERLGRHGLVRTAPRSEFLASVVLAPLLPAEEAEQLVRLTLLDLDLLALLDGRKPLDLVAEELGEGPDAIAESCRRLVENGAVRVSAGLEAWNRWLR